MLARHPWLSIAVASDSPIRTGHQHVELLTQLLLDQPAATDGSLKFSRYPRLLRTPSLKPANTVEVDLMVTADAIHIGQPLQSLR